MKQLFSRLAVSCTLLVLLASCTRSAEQSPAASAAGPAPAPVPGATPSERPAASIRTPATTGGTQPRPAAAQLAPSPATPATGPDLLATDRLLAVAPRDFRIGRLELPDSAGSGARGVVAQFLGALARGEVQKDLLDDESRERLDRSLSYYLTRGTKPVGYRLGEIRGSRDEALANVRLFGERGVAEGEIYVVRREQGWRVSDLQVGLAFLEDRYEPPSELFVPSSYEHEASPVGGE